MTEQVLLQRMKNLGYDLLPQSHPSSSGYSELLVAIRDIPSQQHFDPEALQLWLLDDDNTTRWANLRQKTPFSGPQRIGLGQVILQDRVDKRIEFFTFGGTLETTVSPDETIYSLRSSAPILALTDHQQDFSDQLFAEVEGLLAEYKAVWRLNDKGFAQRLAQLDPLQLYLASLQAILDRYHRNRTLRESWHEFYQQLSKEKEQLVQSGQWPTTLPSLEDLLVKNCE